MSGEGSRWRRALLPGLLVSAAFASPALALPLHVVTSIPPLSLLAAEIGGSRVVVRSILPPGADPHTFEPRPSDAKAVARADLVLVLGSSIDDWIGDVLTAREGIAVVRLDERAAGESEDEGPDPHVWLDPTWIREKALPSIARALVAADPAGASRYGQAARTLGEQMLDVESEGRALFARAPTRSFLAWHPAWNRFAARFGLVAVSGVGESEGREPSLKAMIGAVRAGRAAAIRAVLVEPQVDPRQATVIADEIGVPLVTVDAMGDAGNPDRSTMLALLRFNLRAFAKALGVPRDPVAEAPAVSAFPVLPLAR